MKIRNKLMNAESKCDKILNEMMIEIFYVKWSKVSIEDAPAFEFSLVPSGEGIIKVSGEETIHILQLHVGLLD